MPKTYLYSVSYISLLGGIILALSSSSWLSSWLGLEVNFLAFTPLLILHQTKTEAVLKYFLPQALASLFLLQMYFLNLYYLMTLPLLLKLGSAPLHFWYPPLVNSLGWNLNLILMTIQKLAPLYLLNLISTSFILLMPMILINLISGTMGGINQLSLRKIMAFSSINQMGWIISCFLTPSSLWLIYFISYMLILTMTIMYLNFKDCISLSETQSESYFNMYFILNFLSLSGMPPLLGFLPKWLAITELSLISPILVWVLIISSVITLYFYMNLSLMTIIMSHSYPLHLLTPNWNINTLILSLSLLAPCALWLYM